MHKVLYNKKGGVRIMCQLEKDLKSGYLQQNFRLFHLKDQTNKTFDFHYHDFDKIVIFLSGRVTYVVEGKSYHLKPWDILLVPHHDIHKPIIDNNNIYERIVIWVKNEFIEQQQSQDCDLSACFRESLEKSFNLIRVRSSLQSEIQTIIGHLENNLRNNEFGHDLLCDTYFLQLLVYINRVFLGPAFSQDESDITCDKQITELMKYINTHLDEDLSNETLAKRLFLSKYYLMHRFKEETGYTLHRYIEQKRLLHASELIKEGVPVLKAAQECGFKEYSTFLRAFKRNFHISPKELLSDINSL
jgi:AraC-like DNA-binding protein/mannose-6-phosphate isomerase-like protein (cupin superfamily)